MKKITIKFIDNNCPGPYFTYEVEVSNGTVTINFELFELIDNFKEFGRKLKQFPIVQFSDTGDFNAKYLHGIRNRQVEDRFSINVSTYKTNGHPFINVKLVRNVKLKENLDDPYRSNADFSIRTVPHSIVRLGTMLYDWDPEKDKELIWEGE